VGKKGVQKELDGGGLLRYSSQGVVGGVGGGRRRYRVSVCMI